MTAEKLQRSIEVQKEIEETEHMVSALDNSYINVIRAVDYRNGNENDARKTIEKDSPLHKPKN